MRKTIDSAISSFATRFPKIFPIVGTKCAYCGDMAKTRLEEGILWSVLLYGDHEIEGALLSAAALDDNARSMKGLSVRMIIDNNQTDHVRAWAIRKYRVDTPPRQIKSVLREYFPAIMAEVRSMHRSSET